MVRRKYKLLSSGSVGVQRLAELERVLNEALLDEPLYIDASDEEPSIDRGLTRSTKRDN